MQLNFFKLNGFRNFGLAIIGSSLLLTGCSREMDKATSVSLQLPRVIQSKSAGTLGASSDMIGMYIVTISGSDFPPVITNWEAHKMCPADATAANCTPPPMELVVPKGNNRMIQVLGLTGDGPGTPMTMYYFGAARNFANASEAVDVSLEKLQQTSGKDVLVKGRYLDSANSGPSGSVLMQFHPPVAGHPPMSLFRREILNGWFSFEFFSGFDVSYVLEKNNRVLFSRVKTGEDWMGVTPAGTGFFNPESRAANAKMSILHIDFPAHQKFWSRSEGGAASMPSADEIRSRSASRVIAGYFGDPAFYAGKRVCHAGVSASDKIRGLYAAGAAADASLRVGGVAGAAYKTGSALETALSNLSMTWGGYQPPAGALTLTAPRASVVQLDYSVGSSSAGAGRACASTPDWDNEMRIDLASILDAGNETDGVVSFRGPFVVRAGYTTADYNSPWATVGATGTQISSVTFNLLPGVIGSGLSGVSVYYRMIANSSGGGDRDIHDMGGLRCQAISEGMFGFKRFGPDLVADGGIATNEVVTASSPIEMEVDKQFQVVICPFSDTAIFGRRSYLPSGLQTGYYGSSNSNNNNPGMSCPAIPTNPVARVRYEYNSDPVDVGSCVNVKAKLVDQMGCPAVVTAADILLIKGYESYYPTDGGVLHAGSGCTGTPFALSANYYQLSTSLTAGQSEVNFSLELLAANGAQAFLGNAALDSYYNAGSVSSDIPGVVYGRPVAPQMPDAIQLEGGAMFSRIPFGECRGIRFMAKRFSPMTTAVKTDVAYTMAVTLSNNTSNMLEMYTSSTCSGTPLGNSANVTFPAGSSTAYLYFKGGVISASPSTTVAYSISPAGPSVPSDSAPIGVIGPALTMTNVNGLQSIVTSSIAANAPGFCKQIQLAVYDAEGNVLNQSSSGWTQDTMRIVVTGISAANIKAFRGNSSCTNNMSYDEIPLNSPVPITGGMPIDQIFFRTFNNTMGTANISIYLNSNATPAWTKSIIFHDVSKLKLVNMTVGAGTSGQCVPVDLEVKFVQEDGVTPATFIPDVSWSTGTMIPYKEGLTGYFYGVSDTTCTGTPVTDITYSSATTGGVQPSLIRRYIPRAPSAGSVSASQPSPLFNADNYYMPSPTTFGY